MQNVTPTPLLDLADDQILGANFAFNLASNLAIPETDVRFALSASGVKSTVAAASPRARWQELVGNGAKKVGGRKGADKHRPIIGHPCLHGNKGLTSFEYHVTLKSVSEERSNLTAIGSVTFNEKTHTRTWTFACGPREASETLDEYIDRGVRMGGWEGGPKREDYRDFAYWVEDAYTDVDRFERVSCHSSTSLKRVLNDYFAATSAFPLGERGGFYFVMREGGEACPYAAVVTLADTLSKLSNGAVGSRFFVVPKTQANTAVTAEVVRTTFMEDLAAMEAQVADLKLDTARDGQHNGRRDALVEMAAKLATYERLWGFAGADIRAAITATESMIDEHEAASGVVRAAARVKADTAKRVVAESRVETRKAAAAAAAAADTAEALVAALVDGAERATSGGVTAVVEADAFGEAWLYTLTRDGMILDAGEVPTREAAFDKIREIV